MSLRSVDNTRVVYNDRPLFRMAAMCRRATCVSGMSSGEAVPHAGWALTLASGRGKPWL